MSSLLSCLCNVWMQADKRISCAPAASGASQGCSQKKSVNAIVVCDFCADLWNLGGTCIKNTLDNATLSGCPKSDIDQKMKIINDAIALVGVKGPNGKKGMCRIPEKAEQRHCTMLAMSF